MQPRIRPRIFAAARGKALAYLRDNNREDYERYLKEAKEEVGGCLGHADRECPRGKKVHRMLYTRDVSAARYKALTRVQADHEDLYREIYDSEVEYGFEQAGLEGPKRCPAS